MDLSGTIAFETSQRVLLTAGAGGVCALTPGAGPRVRLRTGLLWSSSVKAWTRELLLPDFVADGCGTS